MDRALGFMQCSRAECIPMAKEEKEGGESQVCRVGLVERGK